MDLPPEGHIDVLQNELVPIPLEMAQEDVRSERFARLGQLRQTEELQGVQGEDQLRVLGAGALGPVDLVAFRAEADFPDALIAMLRHEHRQVRGVESFRTQDQHAVRSHLLGAGLGLGPVGCQGQGEGDEDAVFVLHDRTGSRSCRFVTRACAGQEPYCETRRFVK
jgi:hypothetical protein